MTDKDDVIINIPARQHAADVSYWPTPEPDSPTPLPPPVPMPKPKVDHFDPHPADTSWRRAQVIWHRLGANVHPALAAECVYKIAAALEDYRKVDIGPPWYREVRPA